MTSMHLKHIDQLMTSQHLITMQQQWL